MSHVTTPPLDAAVESTDELDVVLGESRANPAAIARAIDRAVRRETRHGVVDLEVQVTADGVHLRGHCSTYYCKQLAQHAAATVVSRARLHNDIEVW